MAKTKKSETKSVIASDVREGYHKSDVRTPGGRKSLDTNDTVAKEMRGLDMDGLRKFAKSEGGAELVERFNGWEKKLNPGMVRMNLGNAVRALRRNAKKAPKTKKAA